MRTARFAEEQISPHPSGERGEIPYTSYDHSDEFSCGIFCPEYGQPQKCDQSLHRIFICNVQFKKIIRPGFEILSYLAIMFFIMT
jgi:hypothetical protein